MIRVISSLPFKIIYCLFIRFKLDEDHEDQWILIAKNDAKAWVETAVPNDHDAFALLHLALDYFRRLSILTNPFMDVFTFRGF